MRNNFLIIATVVLLSSCNFFSKDEAQKPLVRVFESYLYPADIRGLVSPEASSEDSARIVSQYIQQWIEQQLLVNRAEVYLSEEQRDIEKEVASYRAALLIDRFFENYTYDKIDTAISPQEMDAYYQAHSKEFRLSSNVVKAVYMKLPLDAPNLNDLKKWLASNKPNDLQKVEEYGSSYALRYKHYNHEWTAFINLQNDFPKKVDNPISFLQHNKMLEHRDSLYYHFAYIRDKRLEGDQTPMDFVMTRIKKIIITKRKTEMLRKLKNEIYSEAEKKEYFDIHYDNSIQKK